MVILTDNGRVWASGDMVENPLSHKMVKLLDAYCGGTGAEFHMRFDDGSWRPVEVVVFWPDAQRSKDGGISVPDGE